MKKIIAFLILAAMLVALLPSCAKEAVMPTVASPFVGKVLILSPNSDDAVAVELEAQLKKAGSETERQNYFDVIESGLDTSASVIVDTSDRGYYPPAITDIAAYIKNGGNYLVVGSDPFSEKSYLVDGKYLSESQIFESGNSLLSFESEEDLENITKVTDTIKSLPDSYTVDNYGSGFGNSLRIDIGMLRSKNTFTKEIKIESGNALLIRYKPTCSSSQISVVMTVSDGRRFFVPLLHEDISEDWRTVIIYEDEFGPCSVGDEGDFSFTDVVSVTVGLDKTVAPIDTSYGVHYCFDSMVVFETESKYETDSYEMRKELFPTSYYDRFARCGIGYENPGDDAGSGLIYYYSPADNILWYSFDGQNLTLPRIYTGFTYRHNGFDPDGNITRIQSLVTTDNGDLAWICDYSFGGRLAVIGTADEKFMNLAGYSLALETVRRLLSDGAITAYPEDGNYCTENGDRTLKFGFKAFENATLYVDVVTNESGTISQSEFKSENITKGDDGRYYADITLSAEELKSKNISSLAVTATLKSGDTLLDEAKAAINVVNERKTIKLACVGDSITFGDGVDTKTLSYPVRLDEIEGEYHIIGENYGRGGAAAIKGGANEYTIQPEYEKSLETEADYVFIMLGANDVYQWLEGGRDAYYRDLKSLAETYMALPQHPQVVLGITIPRIDIDSLSFFLRDEEETSAKALVERIGEELDLPVVDLYPYFCGCDKNVIYTERVHPNAVGYNILAHAVYDNIVRIDREIEYAKEHPTEETTAEISVN